MLYSLFAAWARRPALPALVLAGLLSGCNLVAAPTPAPTIPLIPTLTDIPTSAPLPQPTQASTFGTILFLGDSITKGWNLTALYSGAVNGGQINDTSADVLARYLQSYAGTRFDAIVVQVGINDIASGVSDQTLRENLMLLMSTLQGAAGRVFIGSLLPVSDPRLMASAQPRVVELNGWLRDAAAGNGFGFVDYYSAMIDADGQAVSAYFQDGLHPSPAGYAAMANVLAAALR